MNTEPGKKAPRTKHRVLLVDDYESNIMIATSFLEELGYGYDVAQNGREALEKFSVSRYAIVFMDIQMPDMDGLEVTRRMRALEKERNAAPTPIVAFTARATEDDRILCLKAGMNDCLSKPFLLKELEEKLQCFVSS